MNCNLYVVQVMEKELLISRLHRRTDSESSASKADGETAPHELERSVRDFSDRAPLIDSLQRELSSAQVLRHLLMPLFVIFRVPGFLVHGQVTIIFVVSVCLSVCLCRVFLSRLRSDLDQTRTHVTCPGL